MDKTVVLIEDEDILAELIRVKLEGAGLRVYAARDGIAGFDLIKEKNPDLVLLDMLLPGLNGMRVLEKMKETHLLPATPVLIISNSGQPVELERALELGARDYLIKVNFDPQEVLTRVMALLGPSRPPSAGGSDGAKGGPQSGSRVLIVEDDPLLASLLERELTGAGYEARRSFDVGQAKDAIEKNNPDIILLDVVLPGADGFALLEELKRDQRYAAIPVLIISNLGQREEIDKGLRLGAADYIVKANISPAEITKKVASVLEKRIH